jgi:hypothetical protein
MSWERICQIKATRLKEILDGRALCHQREAEDEKTVIWKTNFQHRLRTRQGNESCSKVSMGLSKPGNNVDQSVIVYFQ